MKRLAALLFVLQVGPQAWADSAGITARVVQTMVDSQYYGGCMALLDASVRDRLPRCTSSWITFSCSGDFNPPEVGYRKLDAAQLAMVSQSYVHVIIEDTKLHNGHCFARRVDNSAP